MLCTHRINRLVLREAHGCYAINTHSQNSDEEVDKRDPVGEERPEKKKTYKFTISYSCQTHATIKLCHYLKKQRISINVTWLRGPSHIPDV